MQDQKVKPSYPDRSSAPFIPRDWQALLLLAGGLWILPFFLHNDYFLLLFNVMALNALVVLGLNLLIGSTGQVSLGHAAFYGMGAYISAIASTTWQTPLAAALALAILAAAATSYLLALPTLRLEGHYLVMATLGFNIIVSILLGHFEGITGGPSGFPGIPRLHLGSFTVNTDRSFYYVIWTLFLVFFALTGNLNDSRIGRALQSIHEKELTSQALGIPSQRYKVVTFVLSAIYAATAGFCYAHYVTFISPKTFDIFYSVQIVTMVVVGGMGHLWGGLAGALLLTALPEVLHHFEDLHVLLYGVMLTGVLVFCREGLVPSLVRAVRSRLPSREHQVPRTAVSSATDVPGMSESPDIHSKIPEPSSAFSESGSTAPLLTVEGVSVNFGGLQALHDIHFDVFPGEIVALIGPNGAGKTTLLNVISGLLSPNEGRVVFQGTSTGRLAPHQVAALGIARTFQAAQIYHRLNVIENILLGFHLQGRAGFFHAYFHTPKERREERELYEKALGLLGFFGIAGKAHLPSRELSLFEHKLIELARAVALSPRILLLDEPAGGLNPRESDVLVDCLSGLRRQGLGIILVEHDMNVVMRLADRVVVLQNGCKIASGEPRAIQRDPGVIAAYLGSRRRG